MPMIQHLQEFSHCGKKQNREALLIAHQKLPPPLHIAKHKGPEFGEAATFTTPKENHQEFVRCMNEYYSWFFSRVIASSGDKAFPGIGGFISLTGTTPPRKTNLDYYTVIPQPITRYEKVKELLEQSAEVFICC